MTIRKLDDRNPRIPAILSRESRLSKTELTKHVNLSATPCWARLTRLERASVIRGYRADVSLRLFATHVTIFVMAELSGHRVEDYQAFERAVGQVDEIVACWALGGEAEVIGRANATAYGLVAYLHSQDPRRIYRMSRALTFGMVAVNRHQGDRRAHRVRRHAAIRHRTRRPPPWHGSFHRGQTYRPRLVVFVTSAQPVLR